MAKLSRPALTPYAIHHPTAMLDRMLPGVKMVLFSAPAGFGKTTAMLQWLDQLAANETGTGWLTLDAQDNDIGRFLSYLTAALNRCALELDLASGPGSLFESQSAPLSALLDVINQLSLTGKPFSVFLDDYELITNSAIHELVQQFIANLPLGSQLVIGTRTAPPLGLGRLRAREQLIEIGIESLRFSLDNAKFYFKNIRGLSISERDICELHRCTEGWATALQLASLSLVGQKNIEKFVSGFAVNQTSIADYLAEDVFLLQPEHVRDFLLRTCILDALDQDICNALTGRSDSSVLLDHIEKSNLFLVALDDSRQSHRYHNLFAEFLRGYLARWQPAMLSDLHRRAAEWYVDAGRLTTAVEHALASGSHAFATSLLDEVAESLLYEGRVETLVRYVEALPKGSLAGLHRSRLAYVWALTFLHRYQEARLELAALSLEQETLDARSRDDILTLGPCNLLWSDRLDECSAICMENMPKLSGQGDFAQGALLNIYSMWLTTEERFSEAQDVISTSKRHMARAHSDYGLVYADCIDGACHFSQGHLRAALAQFETVFHYASRRSRYSSASAVAAAYLAEAWYEEDNLEGAEDLLLEYLLLIRQTGLPDHIICAHRILARIAYARGDQQSALAQLNDMEYLGLARDLGRVVSSARLERARIALIEENLERADGILRQESAEESWRKSISGKPHANELDDTQLYRIRLLLKRGAFPESLPLLQQELETSRSATSRRVLLLKLLMAQAQRLANDHEASHRLLLDVLGLAAAENLCRMILDEKYLIGSLLKEFRSDALTHNPALAQFLGRLLGQDGEKAKLAQAGAGTAIPALATAGVDDLTQRELQILKLVSEGMSNRDLASKLFLSEATIKTHMRNINSKLGVHSRTHAIALARARELI